QTTSLHGPDIYHEFGRPPSTHNLPGTVHSNTGELVWLGGCQGLVVARIFKPCEIEGSDCAIQRARDDTFPVLCDLHPSYLRRLYNTLVYTRISVQCKSHLPIASTSDNVVPVWRVCDARRVIAVTLLLKYVGLRLPLPHKQLPQTPASEANPVPCVVDGYGVNPLIRNTKDKKNI
ncbi:hypothetical protein EGW08_004535, partial [Elysia chlorotica]